MKTVEQLAREAELYLDGANKQQPLYVLRPEELQRFHDLAIAQYRESLLAGVGKAAYYWEPDGTIEWLGVDGSGFSTNTGPAHGWKITHYYTADQLAATVLREREACTVAAIDAIAFNGGTAQMEAHVRAAIRGQK